MEIQLAQNFVREFKDGDSFSDYIIGPCIKLFYPINDLIRYCHFDEHNFCELKSFLDVAKEHVREVAFLGGYGSLILPDLFRHFRKNNLQRITDRDLVCNPPIKKIEIQNRDLIFVCNSEKEAYDFKQLKNLWTQ